MTEKPTVLAVDDTPENLHVLMDLLKDEYAIIAAKDGEKALKLARSKDPDIILLDVMMPGMDGYAVIRELKADEQTKDIPVIFVTSLSEAGDETKGLALGAIDYIAKPFNPDIVKARVRNHLELREAVRLREDVERIMRHDLKSPLTSVISLPQLILMSGEYDEHIKSMLGRIEDAGYTLLSMINMSTALFKMERGTYNFVPESMDLAAVVRKVFIGHEDTAQMRGLELVLEIDGSVAAVDQEFKITAEELLCYSMLGNLVGNSVDACPKGGAVRVCLQRQEGAVRISVHNPGEVPEEIKKRFFAKYATSGKDRGTGLGTYSAMLIAQAHGGDISMESVDGEVTVAVTLPQ
ncbi:hybrid sensor histidine kinase/response regulator [Desulfovibrio sp. JC022]|uniref:ATP-binding response regulator n=1 Tax=Desulfovibrio sp. JC022 TaxID=2593642 RepID=UPI0013D13141|nr:hybrid sensor histidine kinase/response regulator [Desulfovibrio sp. JC022]NDV23287.1 response regulator [Desulfovibrio sp. JC022]